MNYFVIDGVYYFCDFVRAFNDRKEPPLYHKTIDPGTLYNSFLSREPSETNNVNSDLYLVALISIRTDREPTRPMTWPSSTPDGNYCRIPLTFAEKESTNILFMREGYTFEF